MIVVILGSLLFPYKIFLTYDGGGTVEALHWVNGDAANVVGGVVTGEYGSDYGDGVAAGTYTSYGVHDVIGYFYGDNDEAVKGHKAIANTYDIGTATAPSNWKYDNETAEYVVLDSVPTLLARLTTVDVNKITIDTTPAITLPIAEEIGTGGTAWNEVDASGLVAALENWNSTNRSNGARIANVYFAFSGQPDKGQGALLPTFTKVGVITVYSITLIFSENRTSKVCIYGFWCPID